MEEHEYINDYEKGYSYLENLTTSKYYNIFEETENQCEYKYGLTLVEYADEEETIETNITTINLEEFI